MGIPRLLTRDAGQQDTPLNPAQSFAATRWAGLRGFDGGEAFFLDAQHAAAALRPIAEAAAPSNLLDTCGFTRNAFQRLWLHAAPDAPEAAGSLTRDGARCSAWRADVLALARRLPVGWEGTLGTVAAAGNGVAVAYGRA